MKSQVLRIDADIAAEIDRLAKTLAISTAHASRVLFLLHYTKKGKPRKAGWNTTFAEARVLYRRRRLANNLLNQV
jgi:hypothetical protein